MAADKISRIYEIVNTINGRRYVGSAVNVRIRKNQHFTRLRKGTHHSKYLQRAWDKYGEASFLFRIIVECERKNLLLEEQKEIDRKSEYNMTRAAGSCVGRVVSDETRAKMSAAHRGKKRQPRSEEHRRNLSAALKGKPKPDHVMIALQAARSAYKFTDEDRKSRAEATRRAYAEGRRERTKSEEHRRKIAETLRGRKASDEARANQSAAQTGKKRGPYNLDPVKAEARKEAGRRLAALLQESRRKTLET